MAEARRRVVNITGSKMAGDDLKEPAIFYCRSGHGQYARTVAPDPKEPDLIQTRIIQFSPLTVVGDNGSLANAGSIRLYNSQDVAYIKGLVEDEAAMGSEPQLMTPEMYKKELQLSLANNKETGKAGLRAMMDEHDRTLKENERLSQLVEQLTAQQAPPAPPANPQGQGQGKSGGR